MSAAARVLAPYRDFLGRPETDVAAGLESFAALLLKWNRVQNLVSRETESALWDRHIADSLQLLKFYNPGDTRSLDLGSGGGFPALPLAIASGPDRDFILVEPIAKKASFLRTAARELGLNVTVHTARTESLDPAALGKISVITSRALASLTTLCGLAAPFVGPGTRLLLHKGREHVEELGESDAHWRYDVLVHPSDTHPEGVLLELRNLRLP